ncbi:CDP-glycerol glycerophosphotransferase family protein [Pseudoalteromonas sp. T1lg88]|uniref:CDP-glycerol glycerophosphotransferase family protein n=1 Tax=Pseudoalteromonas sp. T1lg88 TaxID=2077104 RepID=UPI000CF61460|nr:CDP-glycerol glycerophosphotransferase family protein [Pseudoalteromonas sp. T1lg88]
MKVFFDVLHLYYLPQYLPLYKQLLQQGAAVCFVFYNEQDKALKEAADAAIKTHKLPVHWLESEDESLDFYRQCDGEWIIFGKAFAQMQVLNQSKKTVLMQHGIGPKACYYHASNNAASVRFVEGEHRLARLESLYPNDKFVDTGYAKLDPLLQRQAFTSQHSLEDLGLDPNKPTLLYAPTFYPSSIEMMEKNWVDEYAHCNIIIKPHFFSLTRNKYQKQQQLLNKWAQRKHVYLAAISEFNLVPFMALADVMISDASSAIFEFFALKKPVIWCNFYKLRWSYRGPFAYRFKARLDSDIDYFEALTFKVDKAKQLPGAIEQALSQPQAKHNQDNIKTITKLAGKLDGLSSQRIVSFLYDN